MTQNSLNGSHLGVKQSTISFNLFETAAFLYVVIESIDSSVNLIVPSNGITFFIQTFELSSTTKIVEKANLKAGCTFANKLSAFRLSIF